MQVNGISGQNKSFGAVNQVYYRKAAKDFINHRNISNSWFYNFGDDVLLYKTIPLKDARDTLGAVRKFVAKVSLPTFDRFARHISR